MSEKMLEILPHLNASLNAIATILLVSGLVLIKKGRETAHRRVMISCFVVSALFLVSYLTYHYAHGHTKFPTYPPNSIRYFYFGLLATHIVLAVFVPVLALLAIYHGLKNNRLKHKRIVRWTFPIWLYVSITGVMVYLMLYQLYPPKIL